MVQNLRAHFILHVITIELILRVQEKNELSGMSQRLRWSLKEISDLFLAR